MAVQLSGSPVQQSQVINRSFALGIVGQALLTLLCMLVILRIWATDLVVPFNYYGDTVFYLTIVKSIASGEWTWFNHDLGAPFGVPFAAFPQNITFTSCVMWIISLFTSEPGLIINLFWIAATVTTSVLCHVSLRALGISLVTAMAASTLYALLPYTFYRNTAHVSLTYMFVPVLAAYSVGVLAGAVDKEFRVPKGMLVVTAFSCVAMGLDYIYNSFFACFFLLAAATLGAIIARGWRPVLQVVPFVCILLFFVVLNLIPTLITWYIDGVPSMTAKSPPEAEVYGLKIRQLLSTVFTDESSSQAGWLLETENKFTRLGAVIGLSYVAAVVYGLLGRRSTQGALLWAAGTLTIAGTLLATIGGFGALFAFLVSPEIRAYNRISVFLAFFSVFVLSYHSDLLRTMLSKRGIPLSAYMVLVAAISAVALYDQGEAARPLLHAYAPDKDEFADEREIVSRIEAENPDVTRIYQLPNVGFPPSGSLGDRLLYDHARPYLWSTRLQWSWPAFSWRHEAWLDAIGEPTKGPFVENLLASDFNGLWLDRLGYEPQDLAALETKLAAELGKPSIVAGDRYAFYSMAELSADWQARNTPAEREAHAARLLSTPTMRFERGFYPKEPTATNEWRWSKQSSSLTIYNPSSETKQVTFTGKIHTQGGILSVKVGREEKMINLAPGQIPIELPFEIAPEDKLTVEFTFDGPQVVANEDPRSLFFAVFDPAITE